MEGKKHVKSGEVFDKCVDMSKVKLDALKAQINTKIYDIFQIEKFVYNELKLEQFISPVKMHIHMTEFLNGSRVKQFICELWPILLEAEESAAGKRNDMVEPKKDEILKEVIQTKHQNGYERSESRSYHRSRKQGNVLNGGKVHLKTFNSSLKPQGRIDISKVKLDKLKPWINNKITDILQREDNAAVEFVYNKLKQDKMLCKERLKIRIAGFLIGDKAQKFVCELWPLLLSAQESESGIPAELKQQLSHGKHEGSATLSRLTNSQNSNTGISTKSEQKQHLIASAKKQQPAKENNKNSINIENQVLKLDKSVSKDNQIDKNKSSKLSADCSSQARDAERSHSSRSTSHKKSSSKIVTHSRKSVSDDVKVCGLNGFANDCVFSPKKLQQETKTISQDQIPSTPFREFLSEHCPQTDDFLNLWNEVPDKETILLSDKFVYSDAKNSEKQINNTLLPAAASVRKSDHKQQRHNIDFKELVKAEDEIKANRELQSRKRTHSTMSNESKKSENNSSDKYEQRPTKKNKTKAKNSSTKRSSDKESTSRKPETESIKQKKYNKHCKPMRERMLELFGSYSSDEEECRPDKSSSKKPVTESKEKKDHKKSNNEMSKRVFEIFGSFSSDEENV